MIIPIIIEFHLYRTSSEDSPRGARNGQYIPVSQEHHPEPTSSGQVSSLPRHHCVHLRYRGIYVVVVAFFAIFLFLVVAAMINIFIIIFLVLLLFWFYSSIWVLLLRCNPFQEKGQSCSYEISLIYIFLCIRLVSIYP